MNKLRISTKIYCAMAVLAAVAIIVGVVGIQTLSKYKHLVDAMQISSQSATIGEKVNGLILSIVADSRGIYMAKNRDESEKYAVPLLQQLQKLQELMRLWQEKTSSERRSHFDSALQATETFIRNRTAIVETSRTIGLAEAASLGNNDKIRKTRIELNAQIESLAQENAAEVARLGALIATDFDEKVTLLVAVLAVGLLIGIVSAGLIAVLFIVTPLRQITAVMNRLSTGDRAVTIPYTEGDDEIARMAQSIQIFKEGLIKAEQLETEIKAQQSSALERAESIGSLTRNF